MVAIGFLVALRQPSLVAGDLLKFDVVDASFSDLERAMASGRITSRALVLQYLARIAFYSKLLNPAITVNRHALDLADQLDRERAEGHLRGPLHGIPIALKDTIQTIDMPTTGGALAFRDFVAPYEATLVTRLQAAGAIILAKTVLTELSAFVDYRMPSDYSAVAGYSYNPYDPRPDPRPEFPFNDGRSALSTGGSSSGIGTAASLWAANVGVETAGSILAPASYTMLVGLKPSVGRISRWGVIPLTRDHDAPGPLARTVTDAAILLGAMEGTDPRDPATTRCASPPGNDYRPFLKVTGLQGARIGIPRALYYEPVPMPGHLFGGLNEAQRAVLAQAVQVLHDQGAVVVDPANLPSVVDARPQHNFMLFPSCETRKPDCSSVWLYGMKRDFNAWLATLGSAAPVHSLTELRAWNVANATRGAIKYGQDSLDAADGIDLVMDAARYDADSAKDAYLTGRHGTDEVIAAQHLDALLTGMNTIGSFASRVGYPSITVPFGWVENTSRPPFPRGFNAKPSPFGVTFTSTACQEPRLIEIAYAFEQATKKRVSPPSTP